MALIDATIYDLTTEDGQTQALSDIIDEMNTVPQDTELLNYFNIAAYGSLTITIPPLSTGTFTTSATHGLGYQPAFLAFQLAGADYFSLPALSFQFFPPPISNANYKKVYCDSQNIYATLGGSSAAVNHTQVISFYYYIFNLPMPTNSS